MRILIVDDNPTDSAVLARHLTDRGHAVETAENGKQAFQMALLSPPDVFVSDILMPEMDGYALCRKVRAGRKLRHIPFVLFTRTFARPEDAGFSLALGADRFLRKPMNPDLVLKEIENAVQERKTRPRTIRKGPAASATSRYKRYDEGLIRQLEALAVSLGEQVDPCRKKTDMDLHFSEKRFRALAENVRDVIYRMSLPEGRYEYISPSSREVFGYTPEEFYARPMLIRDIIHPDWRDFFTNAWQALVNGMMPPAYEYAIIHPSGMVRQLRQRNAMVRDACGRPVAIEGVVTDLTDRWILEKKEREIKQNAEAALVESDEKYRLIFEKVPVGISQFDAEGVLIECNERFADMIGAPRERLIGLNALSSTRNDLVRDAIKGALNGEVCVYEGCYTSATGGKTIWGRANFAPVVLRNRKVGGCIGVIEDISDRMKAYHALQESETKYRGLVERTTDIIMLTDLTGRPYYVSPAVRPMLGFGPEEVIGKLPGDFLSPSDTARVEGMTAMLREGLEAEAVEVATPRKDGSIAIIQWNATPVRLHDAIIGFQFIGRDQTERRAAEEEIRNSREKLRNLSAHLQSSLEQERKRIAREIHDALGQTLTGIKLEAAWLQKQIPKSQKNLMDKTEAVIGLVDGTIRTVKKICSELRPDLLDDLGLLAAMEWLAYDFQKRTGIPVQVTGPHRDPVLDGELSTTIFRIFQESLTNIARHARATAVSVSLKQRGHMIELVVRDNGVGITKEQVTSRNSFGVMGMMERVHAFGGGIRITGAEGKGTMLTVRMPFTPQESE